MSSLPAVFRGLLGEPINIDTLGGCLSFRVGNVMPLMLGLWSVLALSGTLAGEASNGSLDLLASTPDSRRSIALQKVAAHVTALTFAMLVLVAFIYGRESGLRRPAGRPLSRPFGATSSCTGC